MWWCPPAEAGLQSMKSSPHLVKGPAVIIECNGAGCECILHANTWQGWHFLTALTQYLKIDGQKYPALKIFWAVENPDKLPPHAPPWQSFSTTSASSWVKQWRKMESTPWWYKVLSTIRQFLDTWSNCRRSFHERWVGTFNVCKYMIISPYHGSKF